MIEYGDRVVQLVRNAEIYKNASSKQAKMAHPHYAAFRMEEKRRIPSMGGFSLDEQVVFCYTKIKGMPKTTERVGCKEVR